MDFRAENGTLRRGDPSQSENFHAIVGDLARVGYWLVNSRIFAGVHRGWANPAVFSQKQLRRRFPRTAEFQRSCWEIICQSTGLRKTPTSRAGV